jgi:hypothetical protein
VYEADLSTPRTILAARYVRLLLTCWHCRHQADADLPAWRRAPNPATLTLRTVQE